MHDMHTPLEDNGGKGGGGGVKTFGKNSVESENFDFGGRSIFFPGRGDVREFL